VTSPAPPAQAAADVPGVIYLEGARQIAVEDCTVEHVGWYGIEIADACHGIRLVGNTINDMGAGGVKINGSDASRPVLRRTGNCRISDNVIHAGGRIFHSAVGVLAMHASQLAIRHNHIYDLYYTGISCGWNWGYHESVTRDNLIEKNHIHDIGQGMLSDMGGIYTLGVQPGTVLRGNLIHDVTRTHYGGWCIYPDEGSSHILIEKNIAYSTNGEVFHQHYGRENIVRNNIFAFGGDAQVTHSRVDPDHKGFTLERNVIITDGAPAITSGYSGLLSMKIESTKPVHWYITCRMQPSDVRSAMKMVLKPSVLLRIVKMALSRDPAEEVVEAAPAAGKKAPVAAVKKSDVATATSKAS
jgi:hypothetical protein